MIKSFLDIINNSIRRIITAFLGDYLQHFMIEKKNNQDYLIDIKI
jgi:hypothetical protein